MNLAQALVQKSAKPPRTWSIVRDDRQSGWFDPGYGVRNDQDGVLENDEPIATHKRAEAFLERLEAAEEALG